MRTISWSRPVLVAISCVVGLATSTWAQETVNIQSSRASLREECVAIDNARLGSKPDVEIVEIVTEVMSACSDYRGGTLSDVDFMQRLWKLERRVAPLRVPDSLRQVIPFRSTLLYRKFDMNALFLFPSIVWEEESRREEVKTLHKYFLAFGDAIGEKKAAVWFTDKDDRPDVLRSKFYCDLLGLDYNGGPYVVTTSKHPALLTRSDEVVVVSLNGISTERIVAVLNVLEKELRVERAIHKRALLFKEVEQRLLTAAERNSELLRGVVVKVFSIGSARLHESVAVTVAARGDLVSRPRRREPLNADHDESGEHPG